MIKLNSITINEMRGIRTISLPLNAQSFVVSGDNGTGKSGVVDAIEFGLTGDISRLSGKSRGNVTVKAHGPHVTQKTKPQFSEVKLEILVMADNRTVSLSRNMKDPGKYTLEPETPDNRKILDEVALHPEIVLSRREIIDLIITQDTARSIAVQKLLKLDGIDTTRKALGSASSKLRDEAASATTNLQTQTSKLTLLLETEELDGKVLLAFVNGKRSVLSLSPLDTIDDPKAFTDGLDEVATGATFNKESALLDIGAATDFSTECLSANLDTCTAIHDDLNEIDQTPELLSLIGEAELISLGIELVDSRECPLCDALWDDMEKLKEHLEEKLANSAEAVALSKRLIGNGKLIAVTARKFQGHIATLQKLPIDLVPAELTQELRRMNDELDEFIQGTSTLSGLIGLTRSLSLGWPVIPPDFDKALAELKSATESKPDQSAPGAAASALAIAEERFKAVKNAEKEKSVATNAEEAAKIIHDVYLEVSAGFLESIYEAVEEDFSKFYKLINGDDEEAFKADFKQVGGKLELQVDFYGLGSYPPNAYHSEGHQDGMGVCLYLALMKQLLPNNFDFAVLDDVVMSIDAGHRKRFLLLIQSEFPNTQFIITTHDRFWAKQIHRLLTKPIGGVIFTGWSVETGPIYHANSEIWDRIDQDLAISEVSSAAHKLRTHLEFLCSELADDLGAEIKYSADGDYDFGELWSAVVGSYRKLLGLAAKSANSFGRTDLADAVKTRKEALSRAMARYGEEDWIVNKVLHHNDWANATADEFGEVVDSVKGVLAELYCRNVKCGSSLEVRPRRGTSHDLSCKCGEVSLNLLAK